jgi:histidine phosphotransferase ChpT
MTSQFSLMYLMCSKICHDLATPLGAISLGLDMLPPCEETDSPINLLKQSVSSAGHKLELFRCLTGYATSPDKPTLAEINELLTKQIDTSKYRLHWRPHTTIDVKGLPARLILALVMIALDSLPRGGEITLEEDFSLKFSGSYCKINESILVALRGELSLEELNSRVIIGYFITLICQELGTQLTILHPKPNEIIFKLS